MKQITLTLMLCIFSICAYAQQITVTGTVTDIDDNPLIGAAVVVVGTTDGVITDFDGKYTIKANSNQSLKFTYVGYQEQTIKINGRTTINAKMAEGEQLDEVVVIGYGSVKKSQLSGAVASISAKDLQSNIARSAAGALQGKVAGVTVSNMTGQPGGGMDIRIRGVGSINNTTAPLYVIDGVYGDINMIDPANIQSMEILKDAAAAAIYGSRAANGVVLITTKGGSKNTKAKVSANIYTGIQNISKKLDVLNANELKDVLVQNVFDKGNVPDLLANWNGGEGTNWQDEVYRTAPITKANISLNGGTETATYNVSAGYINQKGIIKTTGFESFNLHAKNTFSFFNDHFRIGTLIMVKTYNKDYTDWSIYDALRQNPFTSVYDSENKLDGFGSIDPIFINMAHPVGYLNVNDFERHGTDMLINGWAEIDLGLKGLKYKLNVGVNKNNYNDSQWKDAYNWGQKVNNSVRSLNERAFWEDQWLIENTLHYDNAFGKHAISAMVGYSAQEYKSRAFSAYREGFKNGAPHTIDAAPNKTMTNSGSKQENTLVSMFGRLMYSYDSRYLFSASVRRDGSSRFAEGHRYGWFPSVSLGWNISNEAFFEKAKSAVNELKLRASYGVLGNQEIGNYKTESVTTSGLNYIQGGSSWTGITTNASWLSPQDLTWEKAKTWDIGLDASFFDSRLTFTADYYNRRNENLLLAINMPGSSGMLGSPTMNAGTVENKGFEFSLNHRNTVGEVYYYVGANITTISNKVKEVTLGTVQEFGGYNPRGKGTVTYSKVGYPIGGFFLVKTDGLFQNQDEIKAQNKRPNGEYVQDKAEPGDIRFVDFNGDNKIDIGDRQYCGSPLPDFTFGIRAGAEWKGIDFNLFFDGMVGNKIYNYTRASTEETYEVQNYMSTILDSWTPQHTNTSMPRFSPNDENQNWAIYSDRWLEDGSFIRLKTLELGYTLPKSFTQKFNVSNLRIYTAMDNLFTITGYKGYSPDLGQNDDPNGSNNGIMSTGCDHGRYPLARTITFGLQLDF